MLAKLRRGSGGAPRPRKRGARRGGGRSDAILTSGDAELEFDVPALESSLVWIFGSPRTGSTWLTEMLCDPARIDPGREAGFSVGPAVTEPIDSIPVNEFLLAKHIAPAFGEPVRRGADLYPASLNNYMAHKPAYLFGEQAADVWRPGSRRLGLVRLNSTVERARESGTAITEHPKLIIKEVNGSYAADLMMPLFPRSQMVFLVRDGRDVVDSLAHALGDGGWLAKRNRLAHYDADSRMEWLRRTAVEWTCDIDAVYRAYDAQPSGQRSIIRYEDLLEDTAGALGKLLGSLGLRRSPRRIKHIVERHAFAKLPEQSRGASRHRRAARPGLWRENLTEAEQTTLQKIMGERLQRLGYER